MTEREFFNAIANATAIETESATIDELKEVAAAKVAKIDAANEKKRNTPSKTAIENEPMIERIKNEILTTTPITAAEVAEVIGTSVQKASSLLVTIVKKGEAVQGETKIPKKGKVKTYALVTDECADCTVESN